MRSIYLAVGIALTMASSLTFAYAQSAPAAASASKTAVASAKYTTGGTQIGTLLADPAAKTVLAKHIPDIVNNPQIDQASNMTLKDVQQYAPTVTDQVLAEIDTDLAKLPPKK